MMELKPIVGESAINEEKAKTLYENSFPFLEKRSEAEQKRVMQNPLYKASFISENEFEGIMYYWETENFLYLEHLAVLPELRSKGIASRALTVLKEKSGNKPIILEIDMPVDSVSKRRLAFYERNGFAMNEHKHIQPKYHKGDSDLELKILSYPEKIDCKEYDAFVAFLNSEVAAKD